MNELTQHEWLKLGYENGWVSPPVCYTHDGLPTTAAEDDEFEEGDPCLHIVRIYEDADHKLQIEENYGPANWRASAL